MKFVVKLSVLFLALLSILIFARAARVPNKQVAFDSVRKAAINESAVADRLAQAIRYETISFDDDSTFDRDVFLAFHDYLERQFPAVHSELSREKINDYSLLYHWEGKSPSLAPVILLAHMDVVPADVKDAGWSHAPFGGRIEDGYVWGRGSLDMKQTLLAYLEAIEWLLNEGFVPSRSVYLAFGHDEETGGSEGAAEIARHLEKSGIKAAFTLDEGSAIVTGVIPGVDAPVALVGLAEKGYLTLEVVSTGEAGHSSTPGKPSVIGRLARALYRLESHPMPSRLREPVTGMLEYLAPEMPLLMKAAVANRWLFEGLILQKLGENPATNAIVRTTTAPTMIPQVGLKENVMPARASALVNFRILPGDTSSEVMRRSRETIDDDSIALKSVGSVVEPSPVSDRNAKEFNLILRTIGQIFPDALVAPSLVIGGTDSKHYRAVSENQFHFVPMRLGARDIKRIHGVDERIRIDNYVDIIRFYVQLIRNSAK